MSKKKKSIGFWIIAILALLWNIMGVFNYASQTFMSDQLPQNIQDYLTAQPQWVNYAFAISVFSGLIGSILLLMRSKSSSFLYFISLIGALISMGHGFTNSEASEVFGFFSATVLPFIVIAISMFLVWYAKKTTS